MSGSCVYLQVIFIDPAPHTCPITLTLYTNYRTSTLFLFYLYIFLVYKNKTLSNTDRVLFMY